MVSTVLVLPSASPLAAPTHPFKRLTPEEMMERRWMGLCFNCDEPFTHGHKCKNLFDFMLINDYDFKDTDASLMMMICAQNSRVLG